MFKRIPLQSAFPGISKKAWVRFINSLTSYEVDRVFDCEIDEAIEMKLLIAIGNPPAPRLVGIELNPGPPKVRKTIKEVVVRRGRNRREQRVPPRRPNYHNPSSNNPVRSPSNVTSAYMNTLRDPFEYPPVPLGYDCLVNTVLGTGYLRTSFLVNSTDGSFNVFMEPSVVGTLNYTNGGQGVTGVYTTLNCSNSSAIQNQMAETRVVSYGMRLFALFPETSSPGVIFAGADNAHTAAYFGTTTTLQITGLPSSELGIGTDGCHVVGLPCDPSAYIFTQTATNGYNLSDVPVTGILYAAGLSFPVGTRIWVEAIVNLEGLPSNSNQSSGATTNDTSLTTTVADVFPTVRQMWNNLKDYLPTAVQMNDVLNSPLGRSSTDLALRHIRSRFGYGTHFRQQLAAGQSSIANSSRNTLMIEEMKDAFERL